MIINTRDTSTIDSTDERSTVGNIVLGKFYENSTCLCIPVEEDIEGVVIAIHKLTKGMIVCDFPIVRYIIYNYNYINIKY